MPKSLESESMHLEAKWLYFNAQKSTRALAKKVFSVPFIRQAFFAAATATGALLGSPVREGNTKNSPVTEESISSGENIGLNLLRGDGSRNRLNLLLLDWNGTTSQMLQEVSEDVFRISPWDEFKDRINIYHKHPVENLNCNQAGACDKMAIFREVDKITASGITIHANLTVVKSIYPLSGDGGASMPSHATPPNNHHHAVLVRPEHSGAFRDLWAAGTAHELTHELAGIKHEGGDIMEMKKPYSFNPEHTQQLRDLAKLWPYNYEISKEYPDPNKMPRNEIRTSGVSSSTAGQKAQLQSMSFSAEVLTPNGTTQQRRRIIPAPNIHTGQPDGSAIKLVIDPQAHIEIPAPKIGVGDYNLLPDMTYTAEECSSGIPVGIHKGKPAYLPEDDPRWQKFEGWPDKWFSNPCAEFKFRTPKRFSDGITAFSPTNGEVVDTTQAVLRWANQDLDVFYHEVRASSDCRFREDPKEAVAPVWHNLIHGGLTDPINSWKTPQLELGKEYCWQVRPRIQGDGKPVKWSETFKFNTPFPLGQK